MADSIAEHTYVQYILAPALIFLIAGLLIHSFIIGVNVSDWWRGRSVTPVDHIITSLGISRICSQYSDSLYLFLESQESLVIIDAVYFICTYANFWLTSLLSIVLCLKISNLHTRLFLYLRRMISHRTGHLIGAIVFVSTLICLLNMYFVFTVINGKIFNTTMETLPGCIHRHSIFTVITIAFFSLVLHCISSVLLFFSLYHHTTRMKMSSNLSINLETYYSVMKLVSFTFIYNTIYYVGVISPFVYYHFYCEDLPCLFVFMDFLPVLHSSYLIYRTTRLRNQVSEVLHSVINFLFQRHHTEIIESEMK